MGHNDEKLALEAVAVKYFLKIYREQTGVAFEVKEHRDRPDFILQAADGSEIALEVTYFYDSEAEAASLLGRADYSGGPFNGDEVVKGLNDLIGKKALEAKSYVYPSPVSLLVRVASPLFNAENIRSWGDRVGVYPGIFEKVWLLCRSNFGPEPDELIEVV